MLLFRFLLVIFLSQIFNSQIISQDIKVKDEHNEQIPKSKDHKSTFEQSQRTFIEWNIGCAFVPGLDIVFPGTSFLWGKTQIPMAILELILVPNKS